MKWRRIPKEKCVQPHTGTYRDWKEILAIEGFFQCVYCAIHESCFGGTRNFHVEHYRPKSKFKKLENNIRNLFYACPVCNTFKGDDWPGEPNKDFASPSYPNPSEVDYCEIFEVFETGELNPRNVAAAYMAEKINLNRPQLVIERRMFCAYLKLGEFEKFFQTVIPVLIKKHEKQAERYLGQIASAFINIVSLQRKLRELRPYSPSDLRK